MIEYEKKYIISKEKYLQIFRILQEKSSLEKVLQINYYYDTYDFDLYKRNETLRIRQIEDNLKVEHKYAKEYIEGVRRCKESSETIETVPMGLIGDDFNSYYTYKGNMVTERYNFDMQDVLISLDCNYYLGVRDFELEIELKEEKNRIEFWENILKIENYENHIGKYTRFVKQYARCYGDNKGITNL